MVERAGSHWGKVLDELHPDIFLTQESYPPDQQAFLAIRRRTALPRLLVYGWQTTLGQRGLYQEARAHQARPYAPAVNGELFDYRICTARLRC